MFTPVEWAILIITAVSLGAALVVLFQALRG